MQKKQDMCIIIQTPVFPAIPPQLLSDENDSSKKHTEMGGIIFESSLEHLPYMPCQSADSPDRNRHIPIQINMLVYLYDHKLYHNNHYGHKTQIICCAVKIGSLIQSEMPRFSFEPVIDTKGQ